MRMGILGLVALVVAMVIGADAKALNRKSTFIPTTPTFSTSKDCDGSTTCAAKRAAPAVTESAPVTTVSQSAPVQSAPVVLPSYSAPVEAAPVQLTQTAPCKASVPVSCATKSPRGLFKKQSSTCSGGRFLRGKSCK
jgi:hypothetical protein